MAMKGVYERSAEWFIPLIFFVVISAVFTFPTLYQMESSYCTLAPTDPLTFAYVVAWDAHALATNPLRFFDANVYYPVDSALAYTDHLFSLGLCSVPFHLLIKNPIAVYNLLVVLCLAVGGFSVYALSRELTGSVAESVLAGSIFAFSQWSFSNIDKVHLIASFWLVFALLYFHRCVRKPSGGNFIRFGIFYLLQLLSTWYYAVVATLTVSIAFILYVLAEKCCRSPRWWVSTGSTILLSLCLTLPFVVPYLSARRNIDEGYGEEELVRRFSNSPLDYLSVCSTNLVYRRLYSLLPASASPGRALYPGVIAFALFFAGVWFVCRRAGSQSSRTALVFYLVLIVIGFVMSLGPKRAFGGFGEVRLPFWFVRKFVPGIEGMRQSLCFSVVVVLGVAVLAGAGLTALLEGSGARTKWTLASLAVAGVLFENFSAPLPSFSLPDKGEVPEVYKHLVRAGKRRPLVDFQSSLCGDTWIWESLSMYYGTYHWLPRVNGAISFRPPSYMHIRHASANLPPQDFALLMNRLAVGYIVLHRESFPLKKSELLEKGFMSSGVVIRRAEFGNEVLFELKDREPRFSELELAVGSPIVVPGGEAVRLNLTLSTPQSPIALLPSDRVPVEASWERDGERMLSVKDAIKYPVIVLPDSPSHLPLTLRVPYKSGNYTLKVKVAEATDSTRVAVVGRLATSRNPALLDSRFIDFKVPAVLSAGTLFAIRACIQNIGDTLWKTKAGRKNRRGDVVLRVRFVRFLDGGGTEVVKLRSIAPRFDISPGQVLPVLLRTISPKVPGEYAVELWVECSEYGRFGETVSRRVVVVRHKP